MAMRHHLAISSAIPERPGDISRPQSPLSLDPQVAF